tara:strand:+ start:2454 stop:3074 length:621 start_codon:yes stop_codon:yes gene_type:complete
MLNIKLVGRAGQLREVQVAKKVIRWVFLGEEFALISTEFESRILLGFFSDVELFSRLGAEVITPGYQPLPKVSVTLPDGPVLVRAEFDYSSSDEHDLKFKYGDIIVVRKQDDSGWWVGELFQREGLFPRSYVEIIDVNEHRKQAMLWPPPGFRTCIAKYDFAGEGEDELPLVEGQILVITDECEEWYIGEDDKGKIGMFPKVFVES